MRDQPNVQGKSAMIDQVFDVRDKIALVTGASSGLGRHMACLLARAGARVILAARRLETVQAIAAELCADLDDQKAAWGTHLDLSRVESVPAMFDAIEDQVGASPNILINNAGIIHFAKFLDHDDAAVANIFDTNLRGSFAVAREAASRMVDIGGGSIINIASTAGLRTPGFLSAYAVSKAGLIQMTQVMALELAHQNIRVNALCPGNFVTEMHQVFSDNNVDEGIVKRIPQRRFGTPNDLDGPLLLLASDAGRYMTGAVLKVDGGQTLSWL